MFTYRNVNNLAFASQVMIYYAVAMYTHIHPSVTPRFVQQEATEKYFRSITSPGKYFRSITSPGRILSLLITK